MKKTSRRNFLRISALGAGALAFAKPGFSLVTDALGATGKSDDCSEKRFPTYCEVCFWKCAGWTYLNDKGEIQKIIGNDDDPNCNGRLCPRGTGGVGQYSDEDRLKRPMIRTGQRGEGEFKEVSWDEAFSYVSDKMKTLKEKHGSESLALFQHGSGGDHFKHLVKAYGTKNIAKPSFAQCLGPREVAFINTFGAGLSSPEPTDVKNTNCLVLIGNHLGENMHNGHVQDMSEAIDRGATVITVDPRFSTAASKSKFWLPIKPATDISLLLAWMNVIITEELYDKEYVDKYTYGFDQLKAHVADKTPEWAYGITNIDPNLIRKSAREMAMHAPSVIIHPGRHVTWYGDDTQRVRCIAILNAILGSWGRRGGFYFPESLSIPEYPSAEMPHVKCSYKDIDPDKYTLSPSAISNQLVEASLPTAKPETRIHGWIIVGTNLIKTLPDRKTTIEAIKALDMLVVVDTMPVEITKYADVIFPECSYLERYDTPRNSQHREPVIALRMPAKQPKWDTKPAWWMCRELGLSLGLDDYYRWTNYEEVLDWQFKQVGSSLEEMKVLGVKKFPRTEQELYIPKGQDMWFNTNTGKIELYSTDLEAAGFDPLPNYTAHEEPEYGFYRLIYGRAPMHTFGRTSNNPNLTDLMDENSVWINPKVAKEWSLKSDQKIWLKNQDGVVSTFPIKVRITERIRHDSIYMVHGFGHDNKKLSRAHGKGASDSELITNVKIDPVMGGTGMRSNFVTFLTEKPLIEEAN